MSFTKKTVKDINLKGKRVLLRADYNVPLKDGKITGDYRIEQSLQTVKYLLEQNCRIIICSHLGRPDGKPDSQFSLKPIAAHLSKLLNKEVAFAKDCIGPEVETLAKSLENGQILLLENLRFHPEEEANDTEFAKKLASLADVFVQDGFGVVHRAHASTDAITKYLPSVAGLLLENEVDTITEVMENPKRPLLAIVAGAKIADKIEIINRFIKVADYLVIGGAMANTFLLAEGIEVGKSLVDKEDLGLARQIMDEAKKRVKEGKFGFYLPQDGVVTTKMDKAAKLRIVDWDAHITADIENYPKIPPRSASQVGKDEAIYDIGPVSGGVIAGITQMSNTVIWNGTLGVTEVRALIGPVGPFAHGTETVVDALVGKMGHKPFTVVGGGDTSTYIEEQKQVKFFNHVSTGGGASLELMSGKKLPGVEALQSKDR